MNLRTLASFTLGFALSAVLLHSTSPADAAPNYEDRKTRALEQAAEAAQVQARELRNLVRATERCRK